MHERSQCQGEFRCRRFEEGPGATRRDAAVDLELQGADPRIRLLGPTAQDFHAAFGLGNDDKTIVGTNLHGVALAAVQGLHEIVQANEAQMRVLLADKDDQIRAQGRELATLRERLAELEELRGEMSSIQATLRALRDVPLRQSATDTHVAAH